MRPHIPVLLTQCLKAFADLQIRHFVDATVGAGGHAAAFLAAHPEIERYDAIDQDPMARDLAAQVLSPFGSKVHFFAKNFGQIETCVKGPVEAVFADIGVSSMQLDTPERGFSFMQDGPLDMRMDPSAPLTAAQIVNTWTEAQLRHLFYTFGEEPKGALAASIIVRNRPFATTRQLAKAMDNLYGGRPSKIHPATRIFQALRLQVNGELEQLEVFLPKAFALLAPQGRLALLTFHSLEDRIVKRFFQQACLDKVSTQGMSGLFLDKPPTGRLLWRGAEIASDEERMVNPRARSAKLRVLVKL